MQIVREGPGAEHPLRTVTLADFGIAVDSAMETCAGRASPCYALRRCASHEQSQRHASPWSGRDETSLHFALDSAFCSGRMRGRRRWQEGVDESLRLPLFNSNHLGEL